SLANTLDYQKIDTLFEGQQHQLQLFEKVNLVFGNHLNTLAENVITKKRIPSNEPLLKVLSEANDAIQAYIEQIGLPRAREGALILKICTITKTSNFRRSERSVDPWPIPRMLPAFP